jgi:hypothetical protein
MDSTKRPRLCYGNKYCAEIEGNAKSFVPEGICKSTTRNRAAGDPFNLPRLSKQIYPAHSNYGWLPRRSD